MTKREYAVYDTKDNDRLVIIANVDELAEYFKCCLDTIYRSLRGSKIKWRYEVRKI